MCLELISDILRTRHSKGQYGVSVIVFTLWEGEGFYFAYHTLDRVEQSHSNSVCQSLAPCLWFSLGTPVSSTDNTDRHNKTEILLKVALNSIPLTLVVKVRSEYVQACFIVWLYMYCRWRSSYFDPINLSNPATFHIPSQDLDILRYMSWTSLWLRTPPSFLPVGDTLINS